MKKIARSWFDDPGAEFYARVYGDGEVEIHVYEEDYPDVGGGAAIRLNTDQRQELIRLLTKLP